MTTQSTRYLKKLTTVPGGVSKKSKSTPKTKIETFYSRLALIILGIVLVLILTINTQDIVDGNGSYRILASLVAGISALYNLVGVFVLKSRKSRVLLGLGALLSVGLSFYSLYVANFTITG